MNLVPRNPSGELGALASAGRGADVSDLRFDKRELTLDDLPASFARGGALVLASDAPAPSSAPSQPAGETFAFVARQEPKLRRRGDQVVQRRIGWGVGRNLTLSLVHRPVKRDGAVYRPSGSWSLAERLTWSGPATRTGGSAKVDTVSSSTTSADGGSDLYDDEATRFPEGGDALAYLPASVRRSVYARVVAPTHFDGKIVQFDDETLHVVVIRANATVAVGLSAKLPKGGDTWDVAMYAYGERSVETA